jgi:hypothetical protein
MKANINYQEQYSRGELLIRSFFGFFYIVIPHAFLLFFYGIWGAILQFLAFWVILFTGSYPQNWFEYQVKLQRWNFRLNARILNMADGYPPFGLDADDEAIDYDVPYLEESDRVSVLLRAIFGFIYVLIPHGFVLFFLNIVTSFLAFLAWWIVLFTGSYPRSFFDFNLNVLRWGIRVGLYMGFMTDTYPPFSLNPEMDELDYDDDDDDNEQMNIYKEKDLV